MNRLQRAGLKLDSAKCKLFQLKTKFLGHVVSGRGIEPDPEKVRAVMDWSTPRNLTEARDFVALASYYRRFISFFADIVLFVLTRAPDRNRAAPRRGRVQERFVPTVQVKVRPGEVHNNTSYHSDLLRYNILTLNM